MLFEIISNSLHGSNHSSRLKSLFEENDTALIVSPFLISDFTDFFSEINLSQLTSVNSVHVDPLFWDVDPPRVAGNNCKSLMMVKNTKGY
jgi:hypothetical protein